MRRSSHPVSSALERRHTPLLASSGWKENSMQSSAIPAKCGCFRTHNIHPHTTHMVLLGIGRQTLHGFASAATLALGLEPVRSSALRAADRACGHLEEHDTNTRKTIHTGFLARYSSIVLDGVPAFLALSSMSLVPLLWLIFAWKASTMSGRP